MHTVMMMVKFIYILQFDVELSLWKSIEPTNLQSKTHLKVVTTVFVRKLASGELNKCNPQTPNISSDIIVWLIRVWRIYSFWLWKQ